jgi:hypothetical protein
VSSFSRPTHARRRARKMGMAVVLPTGFEYGDTYQCGFRCQGLSTKLNALTVRVLLASTLMCTTTIALWGTARRTQLVRDGA